MKLAHVINQVYFSPWNITREGWQSIDAIVRPHLADLEFTPKSDDGKDFFGNDLPTMEITPHGVAIIPIQGTLIQHASMMDKQCGACSYQDIKANVKAAMDAGVEKIVFNCDSPGGMANGSHELGSYIDSLSGFVRMEAVTDSLMASACYDIMCGVDRIYATESATVGSIGSMVAMLDQSVRYQMEGLKVNVFASGAIKGAGTPGTSLTPEQEQYLQGIVDKFAGMFKARVSKNRLVDEKYMDGRTFIGSDAMEVGLVDEIVDDVEQVFDP